jgi:hypothetical protein
VSVDRFIIALLGLILAGCASLGARTEGTSGPVHWQATQLHVSPPTAWEKRETYQFTLVLRELQGTALTLTRISAQVHNAFGSFPVPWEKIGAWQLAPHGEVRIPLASTRYCPYVHCREPNPLAPAWHLNLTGVGVQGQPIQIAIEVQLPYTP